MRIKRLRVAQGLSQQALAHKAGITREYVNKLEGGRYDPTLSVVRRLAKALKCSISELIGEEVRRMATTKGMDKDLAKAVKSDNARRAQRFSTQKKRDNAKATKKA
jgi:transcriptional regulator with XRE-family HTH domain